MNAELQRLIQRLQVSGPPTIHEKHVAIYQLIDNPESFEELRFSHFAVTKISCAQNKIAETYFNRDSDPNFKRLCQEYQANPRAYYKKFKKMKPVYHEPVEPQKVNLDTFTCLFNEDWTVADKEYMPEFYPRFPEFFKKSKKDTLEKWAKREMLTYWPGKKPETLLDGFKSVEDAMNHFVYESGYCGLDHRVGIAWKDLMAGERIRPDQDADNGRPIAYVENGQFVPFPQ